MHSACHVAVLDSCTVYSETDLKNELLNLRKINKSEVYAYYNRIIHY